MHRVPPIALLLLVETVETLHTWALPRGATRPHELPQAAPSWLSWAVAPHCDHVSEKPSADSALPEGRWLPSPPFCGARAPGGAVLRRQKLCPVRAFRYFEAGHISLKLFRSTIPACALFFKLSTGQGQLVFRAHWVLITSVRAPAELGRLAARTDWLLTFICRIGRAKHCRGGLHRPGSGAIRLNWLHAELREPTNGIGVSLLMATQPSRWIVFQDLNNLANSQAQLEFICCSVVPDHDRWPAFSRAVAARVIIF